MKQIVFLTSIMRQGYGVSVVVDQLTKALTERGLLVVVITQESDGYFKGYPIITLANPTAEAVESKLKDLSNPIVVAHTSPFFELAKDLKEKFEFYAWEHGDPTPELFSESREERNRIKQSKLNDCYPLCKKVISISDFIKSDIQWPAAEITYLGCDHVKDMGKKTAEDFSLNRPLRVGGLMRLGKGESSYKGNDAFLRLAQLCKDLNIEFHIGGAGTKDQARVFEEMGFKIHLNLSEEEKFNYLRSLDVFISLSQWEGFNLPLAEAQALGTLGLALDTGAHPEVCPFIFRNLIELRLFIGELSVNHSLLGALSNQSYDFVKGKFIWNRTIDNFLTIIGLNSTSIDPFSIPLGLKIQMKFSTQISALNKVWKSVKKDGIMKTLIKIKHRIETRLGN